MRKTNRTGKACILVFARAPELGKVKTRLGEHLDAETVLDLYRCFVADTLETVEKCDVPVRILYHPATATQQMIDWLGRGRCLVPQIQGTIGCKMASALTGAFDDGYDRAVLLGTDIPDLPLSIPEAALRALYRNDAVIGPSLDGGYYLIGFHRDAYSDRYFDIVAWSTDTVFSETMDRFAENKINAHVLPAWRDIDTWKDLRAFIYRNGRKKSDAPQTVACLRASGLMNVTGRMV